MARDADLTDVVEPARPVGGVTTRSGRLIHPPDRLISDSVWAQVRKCFVHRWVISAITQDFPELRDEVPPSGGNVQQSKLIGVTKSNV